MKTLSIILALLLAGCAARQTIERQVNDRKGNIFWVYDSTDGIPDGSSTTYYPNGQLRSEGSFQDGFFHGDFVGYFADGVFAVRGFYWYDVLVWQTNTPGESVPTELLTELHAYTDSEIIRTKFGQPLRWQEESPWYYDERSPRPTFLHGTWRARPDPVLGVRLGAGGHAGKNAIPLSESFYGQLPIGPAAVSVQLSTSELGVNEGWLFGRMLAEVGGSYFPTIPIGVLGVHGAINFPIGREQPLSAQVSNINSYQLPRDAVVSLSSSVSLRTAASWTYSGSRWTTQVDLGLDRSLGGFANENPNFFNGSASFAYGIRSMYGFAEFSMARRIGYANGALESIGIGAAFRSFGWELRGMASLTTDSRVVSTAGIEYEF